MHIRTIYQNLKQSIFHKQIQIHTTLTRTNSYSRIWSAIVKWACQENSLHSSGYTALLMAIRVCTKYRERPLNWWWVLAYAQLRFSLTSLIYLYLLTRIHKNNMYIMLYLQRRNMHWYATPSKNGREECK